MSEFPDDPGEMPGEGPPPPWRSAGPDLDLTEATDAAMRCGLHVRTEAAHVARAVAAVVERQVRERIAADQEALRDKTGRFWGPQAIAKAIALARGGAS